MQPKTKSTSGLSRISILALLYAIVVFIPTRIYLTLVTGAVWGVASAWFTLLLWNELSRFTGRRLTKQEACLIYVLTGAQMFIPLDLVWRAWYRTSSVAQLFNIGPYVPDWAAPSEASGVMLARTFLHPAWVLPIAVSLAAWLCSTLLGMGLGLLSREIFIETEKLPFPIQEMQGTALLTLAGKEQRRIRFLAVFTVFGFAYGLLLYALPILIRSYTGVYLEFIPLPWADFTPHIQGVLPGACFGLFTSLSAVSSGLVLNLPVVAGMFIGSFSVYVVGNSLSVTSNLVDVDPAKPGMQSWWVPGMDLGMIYQRSLLYFWAAPLVGIALSVGLAPILHRPRVLFGALRNLVRSKITERGQGVTRSMKLILAVITVGLAGGVIIFCLLTPEFVATYPWIILFMTVTPFVTTLITGRMIGETGQGSFSSDHVRRLLYLGSGYPGVDVWFAQTPMGASGHDWLKWFKVADMTETTTESVLKTYWLLIPFAIAIGYGFVELFWRLAPIPSGRYPGAQIFWEIDAIMMSLWIRGGLGGLFRPEWVLAGLLAGTGMYFGLTLLHSPIPFVAIGVGANTNTPYATTMFLTAVMAFIVRRALKLSNEWWKDNKLLIAAGLTIGESLAVTIAISLDLIINAIWVLPY